jgi:hypothetical protein
MNINVYCDESSHLQHDSSDTMVLGAIWFPEEKAKEINRRIRDIKQKHIAGSKFELKWTKISLANSELYQDLVDYFFDDDDIRFRGLIVPNKKILTHEKFNQTHDDFYYKMSYYLIRNILNPRMHYRIYFDYKDTQGAAKIVRLREVLGASNFDFSSKIIQTMQTVKSYQVAAMQLCDILIGAIGYGFRGLSTSKGKERIVTRIKYRSGYALNKSTLLNESKFNLFVWRPENG